VGAEGACFRSPYLRAIPCLRHATLGGKVTVQSTVMVEDKRGPRRMAYSHGVARVCSAIAELQHECSAAILQPGGPTPSAVGQADGTAVPRAGRYQARPPPMPRHGGQGADVQAGSGRASNAVPICLAPPTWDQVSPRWPALAPSLAGIKPGGISAPRGASRIEDRLRAMLDIPVFHDGTRHGRRS